MKSRGGVVHEADHLRQIVVDDGRVRDKRGLGKTGGEIRLKLVGVGAEQNGTDAVDATSDQYPAQGAFAGRTGENVNGNIGMRCRGCMLQESFGNHEVHWFSSFDLSLMIETIRWLGASELRCLLSNRKLLSVAWVPA